MDPNTAAPTHAPEHGHEHEPHGHERVRLPDIPVVAEAGVKPLPPAVAAVFAERGHRLQHVVWHSVRGMWPTLNDEKRRRIETLGWKPPRVATEYLRGQSSRPVITNGSGEDFLFMHRQMIVLFRDLMRRAGESPDVAWVVPPQPGDAEDAPPAWEIPANRVLERRIRALKTDEYYWSRLRWWDRDFKDPSHLRTLSLGELGSLIEFSMHNDMHMRWSAQPADPDTGRPGQGRPSWDIDRRWDRPAYDYLGEFYSSHVNPFFWRLHGWVDDRIDDWFRAHEEAHPGEITRIEHGGVQWFAAGKWVVASDPWSGPGSHGAHGNHGGHDEHAGHGEHGGHGNHGGGDDNIRAMEEVVGILFPRPAEAGRFTAAPETPADARSVWGAWVGSGL